MFILCLWFRASLTYINNCLTRFNTKQFIYYSASSLYNVGKLAWPRWREVAAQKNMTSIGGCSYSFVYS